MTRGETMRMWRKKSGNVMHVNRRKESERMGIQFECPVCGHKNNTLQTNADRIRSMSDEELAEFLTHINPTNCQDCAFSHGWRCQPDRDDYSSFEKCKEGRKQWLQQPAGENDYG